VYEEFFGLSDAPFRLTPDPRFLYLSAKHAEALAHLRLGLTEPGGFVFTKASTGLVSDPINGVMTYEKIEVVEPAPEKVTFKNNK